MFGGQSAQREQRPHVSGTHLSCASGGDQLAIIGQVARGMTGQGPIDERRYLQNKTYMNLYRTTSRLPLLQG